MSTTPAIDGRKPGHLYVLLGTENHVPGEHFVEVEDDDGCGACSVEERYEKIPGLRHLPECEQRYRVLEFAGPDFVAAQTLEIARLRDRLHTVTVSLEECVTRGFLGVPCAQIEESAVRPGNAARFDAARELRRLDALAGPEGE